MGAKRLIWITSVLLSYPHTTGRPRETREDRKPEQIFAISLETNIAATASGTNSGPLIPVNHDETIAWRKARMVVGCIRADCRCACLPFGVPLRAMPGAVAQRSTRLVIEEDAGVVRRHQVAADVVLRRVAEGLGWASQQNPGPGVVAGRVPHHAAPVVAN
jgi:hypothetical protein